MVILTKSLMHEKHKLRLIETFDYNDIIDHVTNQTFVRKGQMSIKMTKI